MKMRCRRCRWYNFSFLTQSLDTIPGRSYCGLHGGVHVDPDGDQFDLDHRGSCDFFPIKQPTQLLLNFDI